MDKALIFNFQSAISHIDIPTKLNNPFEDFVPEISKIAAIELQAFIQVASKEWQYDFETQKGKMFGVLVVQKKDKSYGFLGTISGKLPANATCDRFVPSVFDDSTGEYFINKGMTALTAISQQILKTEIPEDIINLKEKRRQKSIALQQRLFENYHFLNLSGQERSLLEIFNPTTNKIPPAAAGECAAPKLLQFAIKNKLKPIALSEFWWGSLNEKKEKAHKTFYPACKNQCRPILEYMLEDQDLYFNKK